MGVIDTKIVTMSCKECDIEESVKAHDRGNAYSGSSWGPFRAAEHFEVTYSDDAKDGEPDIASAKCLKCNGEAELDVKYRT